MPSQQTLEMADESMQLALKVGKILNGTNCIVGMAGLAMAMNGVMRQMVDQMNIDGCTDRSALIHLRDQFLATLRTQFDLTIDCVKEPDNAKA